MTFQKQPRRRSTAKKEDVPQLDQKQTSPEGQSNGLKEKTEKPAAQSIRKVRDEEPTHRRVVSQSLQSTHIQRPTVTFVDNRHILPRSLLQPSSPLSPIGSARRKSKSDIGSQLPRYESGSHATQLPGYAAAPPRRPNLEERHANSWGATTVNKRLRNEVFNDAFLKQPVAVQRHQRPASHSRSIPRRSMHLDARPASAHAVVNSGSPLRTPVEPVVTEPAERPMPRLAQVESDRGPSPSPSPSPKKNSNGAPSSSLDPAALEHVKDITGSSAPEPQTLAGQFTKTTSAGSSASSPPRAQRRKRRYSGSGLRRKPQDVTLTDGSHMYQSRGDLKFFEDADDADYAGHGDGDGESSRATPTPSDTRPGSGQNHIGLAAEQQQQQQEILPMRLPSSGFSSGATSGMPSPAAAAAAAMELEMELGQKIPRPINPKEARAQQGSRVEYFLLLEDLTSGMRRPCIMDLKMGTRQYGVDAGAAKRESQRRKCAATTSRELGVRVCGLQAWDARTGTYVFKDKYWGRDLRAGEEFQHALTMFLYDGIDYASVLRHIPTILRKLDHLETTVRRLRGYRFYAASLLMFYDGDTTPDEPPAGAEAEGDDYYYCSTTDFPTDTEDVVAHGYNPNNPNFGGGRRRRGAGRKREIDFKIADFANSVTPPESYADADEVQRPCPPRHPDQPDAGFLRGLRSLRRYFLRIQRDVREDLGLLGAMRPRAGTGGEGLETEDEDADLSVSD